MSGRMAYPTSPCPFGGHSFRWWWNGLGISCWRCHQTWAKNGDAFVPTWLWEALAGG